MKLGMTPKRAPISLAPVLNRIARSACSSASPNSDRHFVDARPGLRVQAFDRHAERRISSIKRVHDTRGCGSCAAANSRTCPGVIGVGPTPCLASQVCGVSRKLNHSNSMPHIALKPIFSARLRTRFRVWRGQIGDGAPSGVDEFAEEERHVAVPRHRALGVEVEARQGIGKAMLPAGVRGVVVGLVARVPAEHDVAKAEAAAGRGSAAPRNLSMCRYLPRRTPSMSLTATLTLPLPLLRTAVSAGCSGVGVVMARCRRRSGVSAGSARRSESPARASPRPRRRPPAP